VKFKLADIRELRTLKRTSTFFEPMIELNDNQITGITDHGERDYPYECCGMLIGRFAPDGRKIVVETFPISNAREEEAKRRRFLIQPDEMMKGERYARKQGLDVVGFYHSHPEDKGIPSQYDLDHAWPTYSYIIVSVLSGKTEAFRSWEMEPDRSRFNEEEILKGI
jgi:proteasome lid subunit RPN8/RPN11